MDNSQYKTMRVSSEDFYPMMMNGIIDVAQIEQLVDPNFQSRNLLLQEYRAKQEGFSSYNFTLPRTAELQYVILYRERRKGKLPIDVIGILRLWRHKQRAYINMVRVAEKMRGKGLCPILINAAVSPIAKESERTSVFLHVESTNVPAIKCYLKCGFNIVPDKSTKTNLFMVLR